MAKWAKLSQKIGQDAAMAELGGKSTLAALLFTWSLPAADTYGILPANPREYRALVWGAGDLSIDDVENAINAQVDAGFLLRYNADGRDLLYIVNYHKYQDVKWYRVGRPDYPLPDKWDIPDSLVEYLQRKDCKHTPQYYGLHGPVPDQSGQLPDQSGQLPDQSGQLPDQSGQLPDQSGQLPDQSCPEPEPEPEPDTDNTNDKGHAPAEADAPLAPPPEPKPARADTPEQACIRRAWEALGFTGPPSGNGYSGLMKLVKEHGIPAVDEWTAHLRASSEPVPEGADPWAWFCRAFRDALKRPWEWQKRDPPQRGRGMKPVSDWANTVIERNPDGTVKM